MKINFYKYQGAGNDFIMIDDRNKSFPGTTSLINQLCDRRFGIGADGLILLQNHPKYDFEMIYFNADGNPSSMCGNGGRCIAAFARYLHIGDQEFDFLAIDGPHKATFDNDIISLQMKDVNHISTRGQAFVLNTGSPHYVQFMPDIKKINVLELAKTIRYNAEFEANGINVNFVEYHSDRPNHIIIRTYERGVEDETLACGTGVVASSLAYFHHQAHNKQIPSHQHINVNAMGGELEVDFDFDPETKYTNIWLTGAADLVYKGEIEI